METKFDFWFAENDHLTKGFTDLEKQIVKIIALKAWNDARLDLLIDQANSAHEVEK